MLEKVLDGGSFPDVLLLNNDSTGENGKLLEISLKYNIPQSEILELFVCNHKGETKLLIDEGVYTKNRHFRLLGSSKKFKNVPLKVGLNNKYKPKRLSELDYFVDSLITYFSWKVTRVLEFGEGSASKKTAAKGCKIVSKDDTEKTESDKGSIYPEIDLFIKSLISPNGRIRRKVFFSDTSSILYDIQDFRYCQNIGREHKSNNIKYVVDLNSLGFYQKCYDPDCADFRSQMKRLPEEICFLFEDDSLLTTNFDESSVDEFDQVMQETNPDEVGFEQSVCDEDLENFAVCAEAILDTDW